MKKIVLVHGLIAGLVVCLTMGISAGFCYDGKSMEYGMLVGYGSMIVAFSLIFMGIKNFRDKQNNGSINFGKAFKVGLFIALLASTMYVIGWAIEYKLFFPDFMEKYAAISIEKLRKAGASASAIANETTKMAEMTEMYKKPLFFILMTYAEILPVGLVVTLIASLILKRKKTETSLA
jgi:hypothetical protein